MADEVLEEMATVPRQSTDTGSAEENTKPKDAEIETFKQALTAILSGELQQSIVCQMYNIPRSAFTYVFRRQGLYASRLEKYSNDEIEKMVNNMADIHANKCKNEKLRTTLKRKKEHHNPVAAVKKKFEYAGSFEAGNSSLDDLQSALSFSEDSSSMIENPSTTNKKPLILLACGSFNPITNMHLRMFELARDYINENFSGFEVEKGIISPVSDGYNKKGLLSATHRINMCSLAIQDEPLLTVSEWEAKKSKWSPTVSVLEHHFDKINAGLPKNEHKSVMLLCGADFLESFAKPGLWSDQDIAKILKNFGIMVISRSSSNAEKLIYENDAIYSMRESIHLVTNWIENEISSTKIRRAVRRNQSIKYLVHNAVSEYISELNLYEEDSEEINNDEELAPYMYHNNSSK